MKVQEGGVVILSAGEGLVCLFSAPGQSMGLTSHLAQRARVPNGRPVSGVLQPVAIRLPTLGVESSGLCCKKHWITYGDGMEGGQGCQERDHGKDLESSVSEPGAGA